MGSPLTILHVVVNMNRGGAETFIMNLYRNIDRSKVQFDFLTFKRGIFDKEIMEMGGKVHRIPYITKVGHSRFIKGLNHFMNENNDYKIVHSHMDKMSGFILKCAKQANIPIRIAHSHNTKSEGSLFARLYKNYASTHILPSATHLYACSKEAAKWLFKHEAKRVEILNNGIEMEKFSFSNHIRTMKKNELGLEKDTVVLGHIGRFTKQKNQIFLLEVLSSLKEIMPNVMLIFVGDGPLRQLIENKVKKLKLEKYVKFLGVRSDIDELLQVFDMFLMPSHHEGLPLTLIEAQSAGLPCLISNKITEEVDLGGLIRFLPIKNPNEWVTEVMNLLNGKELPRGEIKNDSIQQTFNIIKTANNTAYTYLHLGNKVI